jgi:hypothetical protein
MKVDTGKEKEELNYLLTINDGSKILPVLNFYKSCNGDG